MRRKLMGLSKIKFGVLALCAMAAVVFALSPARARADEINLAGSTSGYFNGTPGLTSLNGGNFTFTNNTYFNTNTVGGGAALGLGSFFLSGSPFSYSGDTFTINVNFTSPAGSGNTSSTAQVFGSVSQNSGGVWVINFNPFSQPVYFNGGTDYFQLAVNTLSLVPNSNEELTGFVEYSGSTGGGSTSVPEPPTVILAALGLASMFVLKNHLVLA
jgi:hypothetical protein